MRRHTPKQQRRASTSTICQRASEAQAAQLDAISAHQSGDAAAAQSRAHSERCRCFSRRMLRVPLGRRAMCSFGVRIFAAAAARRRSNWRRSHASISRSRSFKLLAAYVRRATRTRVSHFSTSFVRHLNCPSSRRDREAARFARSQIGFVSLKRRRALARRFVADVRRESSPMRRRKSVLR